MSRGRHDVCLVTALCDPPGDLLSKVRRNWDALELRFARIAVHLTDDTHEEWRQFLNERRVPTAEAVHGWDFIGLHRRRALALGLSNTTCSHFLYVDPDHILRWVERRPAEVDAVLARADQHDCTVIGRSERSFAATPARLRATEQIVNHIYRLITGNDWDLMMAARLFSRRAAELIVRESRVDTLGNDCAWPLQIARSGMSVGYVQADGLTYETNAEYGKGVEDALDAAPAAWMLRVRAAHQHVEAMREFIASANLA